MSDKSSADILKEVLENPEVLAAVELRLELMKKAKRQRQHKGKIATYASDADMKDLGAMAIRTARDIALELYQSSPDLLLLNPKLNDKVNAIKTLYQMGREALNIPTIAPMRLKPISPEDWNKKLIEVTATVAATRVGGPVKARAALPPPGSGQLPESLLENPRSR